MIKMIKMNRDSIIGITLFIIGVLAVAHLVVVSFRQHYGNEEGIKRLECVAEVVDAIRAGAEIPNCQIRWEQRR
jgi:hypothetical protein